MPGIVMECSRFLPTDAVLTAACCLNCETMAVDMFMSFKVCVNEAGGAVSSVNAHGKMAESIIVRLIQSRQS